jgi:hypothetical protein
MGTKSTRLWFLKRARIPPTDRCGKVERGARVHCTECTAWPDLDLNPNLELPWEVFEGEPPGSRMQEEVFGGDTAAAEG